MANYSRKAHSIGAAHVVQKWIHHLDAKLPKRVQEVIVVAALCHDIGHVAFSHLFD